MLEVSNRNPMSMSSKRGARVLELPQTAGRVAVKENKILRVGLAPGARQYDLPKGKLTRYGTLYFRL